jgi:hypothetical protein
MTEETSQRHPYSADLCDRLERMAWGQCATEILKREPRLGRCAVVVLPVFAWDHPVRDTGRKSRSESGDLLFPVKIKWLNISGPVVVLHPKEIVVAYWEVVGGSDIGPRGQLTLKAADDATVVAMRPTTSIPEELTVSTLNKVGARRTLDELASDGRNARWEILHVFENNLRWNFQRALLSVKTELGLESMPVVDRVAGETIQNNILLGDDGSSDSLALRLINRCLDGEAFYRVDPERYVRRALFSSSESAIRRYISDPHIGRKVRKVSEEIQSDDAELVAEEFSRQNPNARLGPSRTRAALTTSKRVASATQAFSFGVIIEDGESSARRDS